MRNLIIVVLKLGSLTFIGSRVVRVLGQKEISNLIEASGWAIVGISAVENVILPMVIWVVNTFDKIGEIVNYVDELVSKIPFI